MFELSLLISGLATKIGCELERERDGLFSFPRMNTFEASARKSGERRKRKGMLVWRANFGFRVESLSLFDKV